MYQDVCSDVYSVDSEGKQRSEVCMKTVDTSMYDGCINATLAQIFRYQLHMNQLV